MGKEKGIKHGRGSGPRLIKQIMRIKKIYSKCLAQSDYTCTFLNGRTEKRPMKLTAKRNGIIHFREGSIIFSGVFPFSDWDAITELIPNK